MNNRPYAFASTSLLDRMLAEAILYGTPGTQTYMLIRALEAELERRGVLKR